MTNPQILREDYQLKKKTCANLHSNVSFQLTLPHHLEQSFGLTPRTGSLHSFEDKFPQRNLSANMKHIKELCSTFPVI